MTEKEISWDTYFMSMCYFVALKSKDKSTKVGSIIVGVDNEVRSSGYNGPPRGFDDSDESIHERPLKYKIFQHAERNAIHNCARVGVPTKGCKMYISWTPCYDCAGAIIQSGISEVIIHKQGQEAFNASRPETEEFKKWNDDINKSVQFMKSCGVKVKWHDGVIIPEGLHGFFSGKEYRFVERAPSGLGLSNERYPTFELV